MPLFENIESASDIRKRERAMQEAAIPKPLRRRIPSTIRISESVPRPQIRILHVIESIDLGGVQAHIMSLLRHFDRTHILFDFLITRDPTPTGKALPSSDELLRFRQPGFFDAEITRLGGRIYAIPTYDDSNIFGYKEIIDRFFSDHEGQWAIVEGHMLSTASIYLPIARRHGAVTVMRIGSVMDADPGRAIDDPGLKKSLFREEDADICFASSAGAAKAVFGDIPVDTGKIHILRDGIYIDRFLYNQQVRKMLRAKLGLENAFVIGNVAQFHKNQNHDYLMYIFHEMRRLLTEDYGGRFTQLQGLPLRLVMLGDGEEIEEAARLAGRLGIWEKVMFLGAWGNIYDYYQIMDYFVLPSDVVGVPAAIIEAQASGLPCITSDTISHEVNLTGLVTFKSLMDSPESWAEFILNDLVNNGVIAPGTDEGGEKYDYDTLMNLHRLLNRGEAHFSSRINTRSYLLNRAASPQMVDRLFRNEGLAIEDEVAFMTRFYISVSTPRERVPAPSKF